MANSFQDFDPVLSDDEVGCWYVDVISEALILITSLGSRFSPSKDPAAKVHECPVGLEIKKQRFEKSEAHVSISPDEMYHTCARV